MRTHPTVLRVQWGCTGGIGAYMRPRSERQCTGLPVGKRRFLVPTSARARASGQRWADWCEEQNSQLGADDTSRSPFPVPGPLALTVACWAA